jgi:Na+-transporting methylmalonyl-CoA/oxaloacetate decarboxylase gamma subunit
MTLGKPHPHQGGAALVAALSLLIVLILLALMVMSMSIQQERMAGNVREVNEAFQAAEATIREIEQRLQQIAAGGTGGLPSVPLWSDVALSRNDCTISNPSLWSGWDDAPWQIAPTTGNPFIVIDLSTQDVGGTIFGNPCRPLEEESLIGQYYLIVARATGPGNVGDVILQSIFYWPE